MPSFFAAEFLGHPAWMWAAFLTLIGVLLTLDLAVFHRKSHVVGLRESLTTWLGYVSIAVMFGAWVWFSIGPEAGMDFATGYLLETTLAMDNIFVIATIMAYFAVPREYQHKVLFWGIIGVIVLRGVMITAGAAMVHRFEWILLIFAAFLVYTGVKMLRGGGDEAPIEHNPILNFLRKRMRVTTGVHGAQFFVREPDAKTGKMALAATPLFVALVMVEIADIIFAVDSVPAIFSITTDPFIVYTSNLFAILGLRTLFFALSAMIDRFSYLKYALSLVLIYIGAKVLVVQLTPVEHVPAAVSLGVTVLLLVGGVVASLFKPRDDAPKAPAKQPLSQTL